MERRFLEIQNKTVSEEVEGKKRVRGIIPYNQKSEFMGFYEIISETAFNKTLNDGKNVVALLNHDTSKVLGSVRSGTLKLESTSEGLFVDCELPETSYGKDLYETIKRGDVNNLSFGFVPVKSVEKDDIRYLTEVRLEEVSFGVPFPAYPSTDSVAFIRSLDVNKIDVNEIDDEIKNKIVALRNLVKDEAKAETIDIVEATPIEPVITQNQIAEDTSKVLARAKALILLNSL